MRNGKDVTVLRGGRVITGDGERLCDVYIEGNRIIDLVPAGTASTSNAREIDVSGKYVVPGLIDAHVHLREMGDSDREDFSSGTQAAAIGGITTVMDMPNSKPNVITIEDYNERRSRVETRAYVNIGLYVWACEANAHLIEAFGEVGPIGFKIFTAETGAYDPEFKKYITTDPGVLYRILKETQKIDSIAAIHSESQSVIKEFEEVARGSMKPDLAAYTFSRPQAAEDVAVFSEVAVAREASARVHICHVVGKGAVDFIRWAKREYYDRVTCEVAPHNLLLNVDDAVRLGSMGKFSPPVQGEEHRQALWAGLRDGTIDIIGSDHAPQYLAKKQLDDIWKASPGSPALDYWAALMLRSVSSGDLTLRRFIEVASETPAKIFGLYPRKGVIEVGADADLVVLDMEAKGTVDSKQFMSKAKYSAFDGWPTQGASVMTIVGGVIVAKDGKIVSEPGAGKVVSRLRSTRKAEA